MTRLGCPVRHFFLISKLYILNKIYKNYLLSRPAASTQSSSCHLIDTVPTLSPPAPLSIYLSIHPSRAPIHRITHCCLPTYPSSPSLQTPSTDRSSYSFCYTWRRPSSNTLLCPLSLSLPQSLVSLARHALHFPLRQITDGFERCP